MEHVMFKKILVAGGGRMAAGVAVNFLRSGAVVYFVRGNASRDESFINTIIADCRSCADMKVSAEQLQYITSAAEAGEVDMAVCITEENITLKQQWIQQLGNTLAPETIIGINTGSFSLQDMQAKAKNPGRVIGLNWCEPAYTTYFLEVIADDGTPPFIIENVEAAARNCWHKDPYIVHCGYSVKARLMAALAREAFYLVEHGYASVEDIDRACRNDAGYYLPFAGNCRYMDLMGTYAYGLVMKDLNRELSKAEELPLFFNELIADGKTGMDSKEGFYTYSKDEVKSWEEKFREFSFEIRAIIDKYPFEYLKERTATVNSKIPLNE
ncbi:MAG: 3-hydroxyacyl-CoA dehydrogenase [Chitinophagaceae bacterium]|nr:3-hydroxyacyl-CoA dehydrogenase [Chitinophagaceae bacterium]